MNHCRYSEARFYSDQTMDIYQYSPLVGPHTIRVLQLHGGSDRLQCSIRHESVFEAHFSALSYAWGQSEKPFSIEVVGDSGEPLGSIPLTANLNHALHDLASSDGIPEAHFWIDQICINQDDIPERGSQVALMSSIYQLAERVVTYIGPQEPGDTEALALLMRIHRHFEPYYYDELAIDQITKTLSDATLREKLRFDPEPSGPAWRALRDMSNGDWAWRVWMVQENLLNRNTVMLRGVRVLP